MTIAVLGEALIDMIIGEDGAYRPHLGGSPYNVAIGLARQEVPVSYLSCLSDDRFGDELKASLDQAGVQLPLRRRSLWPTSLALVTVNEVGLPSYRLYREGVADKDTSLQEIVENLPADLQVFHTGSLAITPSQLPKINELFRLLKARDVCLSVDINIRLRGSIDHNRYLNGVRSLLSAVDIVKASDEDIDAFAIGGSARSVARRLHEEMEGGMLVLTEGNGGATLFGSGEPLVAKAFTVPRVSDTVGAGDSFHAAFLACLYRAGNFGNGADLRDEKALSAALEYACAAAAINVSRAGCEPPTTSEVAEFLRASVSSELTGRSSGI